MTIKQPKLYITGDMHGEIDIDKLAPEKFKEGKQLASNDYVIVAGDFGCIYYGDKRDEKLLKWLEKRPFTTLFIEGNHENFNLLNAYLVEKWHGGKVRHINKKVIHLMRGQIFDIAGLKIFTFGGAVSSDKAIRRENISWWKEEMPTQEEMTEGIKNLEKVNWKVDYIITHTAPSCLLNSIHEKSRKIIESDDLTDYLDVIYSRVSFKRWYFGHFHICEEFAENMQALYYGIYKLRE